MNSQNVAAIKDYLIGLQSIICETLEYEEITKKQFFRDNWERANGSYGITAILEAGENLERAGVNFSHIKANTLPKAATLRRPDLAGCSYEALGLSLVIHPKNPYAPTSHANIRFFCAYIPGGEAVWWFGGGYDLTPYYGFEEDCIHWHTTAAKACAPFGADVYSQMKAACDAYFYLPHRREPRGVGGVFFDDLNEWGFEKSFYFMQSIGDSFLKAYLPILQRRLIIPYTEKEREFQQYRRGRYVEFNLLADRGTLFGLQAGGRVESILMSMPPIVRWRYAFEAEPGSPEARLYSHFLPKKDWAENF